MIPVILVIVGAVLRSRHWLSASQSRSRYRAAHSLFCWTCWPLPSRKSRILFRYGQKCDIAADVELLSAAISQKSTRKCDIPADSSLSSAGISHKYHHKRDIAAESSHASAAISHKGHSKRDNPAESSHTSAGISQIIDRPNHPHRPHQNQPVKSSEHTGVHE